ncbi:Gamma-glutamyltranspeptidase [Melia azedarach]|uniref:Gamma-glutamyltranspeptidase n=1 Tax=Melia azedarach TaxID=155640 RepID=A0ACC1XY07_MELAZ|nr:Gamma-glutamyltranspeptidase [Melia azedarach]
MSSLSVLCLAVVLLFLSLLAPASARREEVVKSEGVVATDDGRCSEIGRDVLKNGGNAVDAAVAAAFCLGVVSPASSGIGGGAFMLIRLANGTTKAFDMRETAPMKASQDMYNDNHILKKFGILSVAVPGEVKGLFKAWKEHGSGKWADLLKPAENLARNGFKISPYLRHQMEAIESGILADEGLRRNFAPDGKILNINDTCYNRELADTLQLISKEGPQTFYMGEVARRLINDIRKAGGIITMEDLRNYEVKMREPIVGEVLDHTIIGMPPPSAGAATMLLMLNVLSLYQIPYGLFGDLGVHRKIEALKHGFALRSNLGDPDFVNVSAVITEMLSPRFAMALQRTISDQKTYGPLHYGGRWNPPRDHGTSHVSIVDKNRNAVAMTCTVNSFFGSEVLSPSTGIVLNNQMDDFETPNIFDGLLSFPNFISPGKRPLSSMSPTIILKDGKLKGVLGGSGGAHIIGSTTQVFLNHFVHEMGPLEAIMAPRFYHTWVPNKAYYENLTSVIGDQYQMAKRTVEFLKQRRHSVKEYVSAIVCQFVKVEDNGRTRKLVGASDPRKGGYPAGY